MSKQCCVNVLPTLYVNQYPNIVTTSANVQAMLCECWCNVAPQRWRTTLRPTFRQHCVNVVATSLSTWGANIETIFRQRCLNISAQCGERCWDSVQAMVCGCCVNVGVHFYPVLQLQPRTAILSWPSVPLKGVTFEQRPPLQNHFWLHPRAVFVCRFYCIMMCKSQTCLQPPEQWPPCYRDQFHGQNQFSY